MSAIPEAEVQRRKMNVAEGLTLAAVIGMAALLFNLRDSMVQVQEQLKAQNVLFTSMQSQLSDVPSLNQRLSKVEVKQDNIAENIKEIRAMKGIK